MNPLYERFLAYFDRSVLASYRQSPDRYSLREDEMGGELVGDGLFLRFAHRRLEDGGVRLALFSPDLEGMPEQDKGIWRGFHTGAEAFAPDDEPFERWTERNFEASWEVEDGPIVQISGEIELIQAMTRQALGQALFRAHENPDLTYPAAENTVAYRTSSVALHALMVDGLIGRVIAVIADRMGRTLTRPQHTLNSLKQILPVNLVDRVHAPLVRCSKRRNKVHGVGQARTFPAFSTFHSDLAEAAAALSALKTWLAQVLDVSPEACLEREKSMAILFPTIVGPPRPAEKESEINRAVGKTVASVKIGEVKPGEELHESEALEINFTDGTTMSISIRSNAWNLSGQFEGLAPPDVHTDLMVFWAPSIRSGDVDSAGRYPQSLPDGNADSNRCGPSRMSADACGILSGKPARTAGCGR